MNASERQRIRQAVDESRRAELEARGGFHAQEVAAVAMDRHLKPLSERELLRKIARLEDALELSRRREENARKTIKRYQARLTDMKRRMELWQLRYERVKGERAA